MPKNVMKLLKRTANHARNAFDMSHRHLVMANFGELLPITCLEVVPDDYVELSVADLLRAAPMVTSPFLRAKQHIDVYYVPYCDIWQQFEAFMTRRSEPKHANAQCADFVPHINLYDLQSAVVNSANRKDIVGLPLPLNSARLLDLLGYGRSDTSGSAETHPSVNLWRLAAYNKIWYEHYRQQYYDNGTRWLDSDDFESGEVNPAVIFNFDDLFCYNEVTSNLNASGSSVSMADTTATRTARLQEMIQMRYRLWKKDLFTGLLPSTQFGNVSTVPVVDFSANRSFQLQVLSSEVPSSDSGLTVSRSNGYVYKGNQLSVDGANPLHFKTMYDGANRNVMTLLADGVQPKVNILDLRKTEAMQIWREAALTAGNRIADNLRAHYGDDAEYAMHESQLIGSVSAPLNISDVNATAQTATTDTGSVNTSLGDVAGKGISTLDNQVIKFKAKKFGVIMVMFSLLPEAEYQSTGIDRMNQLLEQEDYFVPEYMDLGLEPVSSLDFYNTPLSAAKVIGYAPRYIGYKQKLDKCFQGFWGTQMFAPWASPKDDVATAMSAPTGSLPLATLYVNPTLFNRNFVSSVQNSVQFICDFFFDCTKVSPMSISSLPRL